MKKLILITACILFSATAFSQKGKSYAGGGLNFGTDIETVGITFKYGHAVIDKLYIEPNFNVFLKNNANMWDINIDVNYRFYVGGDFYVYPIAGVSLAHYKQKFHGHTLYKTTKFGLNLGAGISYDITRRWFVNMDFKYRIMNDIDQGIIGLGCGYRF